MNRFKLTFNQLFAIGVSHWDTPIEVREQFTMTFTEKDHFLNEAYSSGFKDIILLNTCNRTELVVFTDYPEQILELFIHHCQGNRDLFQKHGFIKSGQKAAEHFFKVAVGLDSQILGDLQIIHQVKEAYEFSHNRKMIGKVLHRFVHSIFKAHKRSRRETGLASGAATTAYAAVQCARHHINTLENKKILLVGTGQIGKVTCMNLMSFGAQNVTLVNRNNDRAVKLGKMFRFSVSDFENLGQLITDADLIIVATDADTPIINSTNIPKNLKGKERIMIDMSVPRNIDPALANHQGIRIFNLDMLQEITDNTNRQRVDNIPVVENIIAEEIASFKEWFDEQQLVPIIKEIKTVLENMRQSELEHYNKLENISDSGKADQISQRIMKKFLAYIIRYIKENHEEPEKIKRLIRSIFKIDQKSYT